MRILSSGELVLLLTSGLKKVPRGAKNRGSNGVVQVLQGDFRCFKGFQERFRGSHEFLKGPYKWFQGRFNAFQRVLQGVSGTF